MFGRSKSVVGLDIGSSAVKAVELKAVGKGYKVAAFGNEPIPPDSIVDGAIIDGGVVSDAIRRLFEQGGIKTKRAALRRRMWPRRCQGARSSSRRSRCR